MSIKICNVLHRLVPGYHFNPDTCYLPSANQHPLGDVFKSVNGWGYVMSGSEWLEFDLRHLPKLTKARKGLVDDVSFEKERQAAVKYLRNIFPVGSLIYTLVLEKRRSGDCILVFLASKGSQIKNISEYVSKAVGGKWLDRDAVISSSAAETVHFLSHILHGYKDVGGDPPTPATENNYRAGYTLIERRV